MNEVTWHRNKSHKPFFEDKNRWLISYGGAGSAKSYSTAQKILDRIINESDKKIPHRFLVLRQVAKTLRASVFQLFKDIISELELNKAFKINKTDMTIEFIPNGNMILFAGLDDVEKLKSIQRITSMWVEESSETEMSAIMELNRRLRGFMPFYKQIILTFNPISHLHWLKSHFFDNPRDNVAIYKTTYLDNAFIDDEYKKEIEDIQLYDEQQYRIYALGEWGILNQNIIHHRFKPKEHLSDKTVNDFFVLHIGCDFNVGGSVCVVMGEDNQGISHIVDEFSVYDTENMIIELKARYPQKQITLYPDASGDNRTTNSNKTDVDMLRDAGFYCLVPNGNGATSTRYNACNRRFMANNILINPKTARKTYEALQTHAYDENGKPEKFKEHKGGAIDDYTDAFGYIIVRMYPITSPLQRIQTKGY